MQYHSLILNRSFLIYVGDDGLYGLKFSGMVTSSDAQFFEPAAALLDNPFFTPGTPAFQAAMQASRANFFIPRGEISEVEFDPSSKWGMGKIEHGGRLMIRLNGGGERELVLLGGAHGDGIRRFILDRYGVGLSGPHS